MQSADDILGPGHARVLMNTPPGLSIPEWGPLKWNWLHTEAIRYPDAASPPVVEAERRRLARFLRSIPCAHCLEHATAYFAAHPPALGGSLAFQHWVWTFHNAVNARLGHRLVAFDEYLELYSAELQTAAWFKAPPRH